VESFILGELQKLREITYLKDYLSYGGLKWRGSGYLQTSIATPNKNYQIMQNFTVKVQI